MSHRSTEQLEAEIADKRADLADTVDALHAKLDVKSRAKDGLTTDAGKPKPQVLAAAGVAVALVAGLVVLKIRRNR